MKKTLKQIREEVRKEVRKEYEERINIITKNRDHYKELWIESTKKKQHFIDEVYDLREQIIELNEKLCQYEDWVERLQDFCNLPENERLDAIRKYNVNKRTNMKLSKIFDSYLRLFDL